MAQLRGEQAQLLNNANNSSNSPHVMLCLLEQRPCVQQTCTTVRRTRTTAGSCCCSVPERQPCCGSNNKVRRRNYSTQMLFTSSWRCSRQGEAPARLLFLTSLARSMGARNAPTLTVWPCKKQANLTSRRTEDGGAQGACFELGEHWAVLRCLFL
jgi:hypothetical protein